MKRYIRRRSGFTLVELLVAVALTLFIMSLFTVLMRSAAQGVRDAKGINAVDQRVRNAVVRIRSDLQSVYLANNGQRFSPSELFTRPDRIATEGYLSIEANDRALSVGVDANGNPMELDYDDVLSMTVARGGTSVSDTFFGKAGRGYANAFVGSTAVDLGQFLDNIWRDPASRFDLPDNQLVSSRFAEVVYFARPQDRQYTLADLGADPVQFNGTAAPTLPPTPALFTLYRRQLLVLNDDAMNRPPATANGFGPVAIPNGGGVTSSFYHQFDVSASREYSLDASFNLQATQNLHFNTLADLTRRELRYGMQPVIVDYPSPFDKAPYSIAAGDRPKTLRAFPLSHVDSSGAGANLVPHLHDYYRSNSAALSAEPWIGRPTLSESAHPKFPLLAQTPAVVDMTIDPATGGLNAYPVTAGQRAGDDVLLRDVVSWSVRVFESMAGFPGDLPGLASDTPVGNDQVGMQGSAANGQNLDHDLNSPGGLYNTAPDVKTTGGVFHIDPIRGRRPQFVDLGYGADQFDYRVPTGGDDTKALGINVLTVANYLFQTVPAPPKDFKGLGDQDAMGNTTGSVTTKINGVSYTYQYQDPTSWSSTYPQLDLTGSTFNFVWPPTGPTAAFSDDGTAANTVTSLMRGAYSPRSAPFGVPLDMKLLAGAAGTDVTDATKNSDLFFGPDGKAGIGLYSDLADHTAPPDTGLFAYWQNGTPAPAGAGEYFGPSSNGGLRADDLNADTTNANSAATILASRPGILGADGAQGARGIADDGQNPLTPDPSITMPVGSKPVNGQPWIFSELFAQGTDDNPFVGIPFKLSGQVAANPTGANATHPFNLSNANPRNTYDSWSAAPDMVHYDANGATYVVLPAYKASPVRQASVFGVIQTVPPMPIVAAPDQAVERSYIPEPNFRPVPYPRPLKGIQIKLRILERRTGIVRDVTIRHYFPPTS